MKKSENDKYANDTITSIKISIGDNNDISGNIAGRDIIINDTMNERIEELVKLLQYRAEWIEKNVFNKYEYSQIEHFLNMFRSLHEKHIAALNAMNLILAHEILIEIHKISCQIEVSKGSMRTISPGSDYAMSSSGFERGALMCFYMTGDFRSNSPKYPKDIDLLTFRIKSLDEKINRYLNAFVSDKGAFDELMPNCSKCGRRLSKMDVDGANFMKIMKYISLSVDGNGIMIGYCRACKSEFAVLQDCSMKPFKLIDEIR